MSFSAYISSIYTLIGLGGLVVTCGFAGWKGGAPERLGALMLAVSWIGTDIARGFSNEMIPTVTIFVSDITLAIGFLYIAIRYSSLWLGAMMILEAVEFFLHATQLADPSTPRWHGWIIYLLFNNLLNYSLLLTLFGGVWAAIGKRRRLARQKAEAEAKAEAKAAARPASRFRVPPQPPAAAF